jgi:hypothetical protein
VKNKYTWLLNTPLNALSVVHVIRSVNPERLSLDTLLVAPESSIEKVSEIGEYST